MQPPSHSPQCQYPLSARTAALILFSPVRDFTIIPSTTLGVHQYKVDTSNFTVESSDLEIPPGIRRNLEVTGFRSLNDLLLAIIEDPNQRAKNTPVYQALQKIQQHLATLVECGLHNRSIPTNIRQDLKEQLENLQVNASIDPQLAPVMPHMINRVQEVTNMMHMELAKGLSSGEGPGRIHD